jgi:hypothetical protein
MQRADIRLSPGARSDSAAATDVLAKPILLGWPARNRIDSLTIAGNVRKRVRLSEIIDRLNYSGLLPLPLTFYTAALRLGVPLKRMFFPALTLIGSPVGLRWQMRGGGRIGVPGWRLAAVQRLTR